MVENQSLVLDTRVLGRYLGAGVKSIQSRYIPSGGFLLSRLLGHLYPETKAGLSITHQLHPFCAQDRAFPSIAFHSVTTISKLALN